MADKQNTSDDAISEKSSNKDWGKIAEREELENACGQNEGAESSSKPGRLEHLSYNEIESLLTDAEQRAQKNYDSLLRVQAEFDNYKKRAERDLTSAHKFGVEKLVLDIIPVLDGLDQGLETKDLQETNNDVLQQVRTGMELTYKLLLTTLNKYGVVQINPEGELFDPSRQEAISMQEAKGVEANRVIKVFQKGYLLHDRLIRPARVIVAKAS